MTWPNAHKITNGEIDRIGEILSKYDLDNETKEVAFEELDKWRVSHSYPMHILKKRLKKASILVDKNSVTAQRLKRTPAIIKKLTRSYDGNPPTMRLSQMQDIGGCRAILSTVSQVKHLYEEYYLKGDIKHKRVSQKDYITSPKKDGYRGIHLIYRFFSDKKKSEYNGLLIEIQLRSKLQHVWATAVETVGLFTKEAIKSNEGSEKWLTFFRLVSAAFARMEECPNVPNTPLDQTELYEQIKNLEKELKVRKLMRGWAKTIQIIDNRLTELKTHKFKYFLLELDTTSEVLRVSAYRQDQEKKALEMYSDIEKKDADKKLLDVVLVGIDKASDLRKTYPNYFVDTGKFLLNLEKIIGKD